MSLTIKYVEEHFAKAREMCLPPQRIYAEIGRYKPFSMSTLCAAQKRGYKVVKLGQGTYEIHDKEAA